MFGFLRVWLCVLEALGGAQREAGNRVPSVYAGVWIWSTPAPILAKSLLLPPALTQTLIQSLLDDNPTTLGVLLFLIPRLCWSSSAIHSTPPLPRNCPSFRTLAATASRKHRRSLLTQTPPSARGAPPLPPHFAHACNQRPRLPERGAVPAIMLQSGRWHNALLFPGLVTLI